MTGLPRQKIMATIGADGCYLLCLCHIGEGITGRRVDAVEVYERAIDPVWWRSDGSRGALLSDRCYLHDPATIMELICGGAWHVRHEPADHAPAEDEWEVLRYERQAGSVAVSHFVLGDGAGAVAYDPMGDSVTVRDGRLVSKRIFTRWPS